MTNLPQGVQLHPNSGPQMWAAVKCKMQMSSRPHPFLSLQGGRPQGDPCHESLAELYNLT